jgi:nitroreductase
MTPATAQSVVEALRWRYATKKFDPSRRIPESTWHALEQALVLSPSSMGLQPWKFIVIQDPGLREKLSAASWGQSQPVECSHFVVFAGRRGLDGTDVERHVSRTAEVRGVSRDSLKGYADMLHGGTGRGRDLGILDNWMANQVYIALGSFMTAASILGVDTCPMEGLEPATYDAILGLDGQGYGTLCACAAGYRSGDDKYAKLPKVRFKPEDVIVRA